MPGRSMVYRFGLEDERLVISLYCMFAIDEASSSLQSRLDRTARVSM